MNGVLTGHPSRGLKGRTVLDMNSSCDFAGQVALVTGATHEIWSIKCQHPKRTESSPARSRL